MYENKTKSGNPDGIHGEELLIWTVPENIRKDYLARQKANTDGVFRRMRLFLADRLRTAADKLDNTAG